MTGFELKGSRDIDEDDLEEKLATRVTSRFFGVRGLVYEYEIYDRYALERDLARIERYYRARGFYEAKVRAARVRESGADKVEVEIHVVEGDPVRVARVQFEWSEAVPEPARRATEAAARKAALAAERRFDEDAYEQGERAVVRALGNRGHADATATRDAEVDLIRKEAIVTYRVTPGEAAVFGPVTFVGRGEIPEAPVRSAFAVHPGDDYSLEALEEGRQALLELNVFATVNVVPAREGGQVDHEPSGRRRKVVPIRVNLELGKLRTIRVGGGVELSSSRIDVHGLLGWRGENTLGGLRRVDLTFQPGVALYPTTLGNLEEAPDTLLPFQRTRASLRRPAFLESRTVGLLTAQYAIYPQLFAKKTDNVIGYHEVATTAGLMRPFGKLVVQPTYGFQANFPYNAVGRAPLSLDPVLVSYVELHSYLDFRNQALRPTKGAYLANTVQFAGGPFGGNADDIRIQPEARGYVPLSKRVSLAVRAAVAFLFPRNYTGTSSARFGRPELARTLDQGALARDYQILYFRGLFGGGPTSNRGYPLRGIGPHDAIPYLIPAVQAQQASRGCQDAASALPAECLLPTGGLSQWESTVELRFNVSGPLLAATFCDAGDVSPYALGSSQGRPLRFDRLHLSCGAGVRYDTPAGPIRFDLGVRIPGLQTLEDASAEGKPYEIFTLPLAINFGIGEAF